MLKISEKCFIETSTKTLTTVSNYQKIAVMLPTKKNLTNQVHIRCALGISVPAWW